jgi:hypothetical protein
VSASYVPSYTACSTREFTDLNLHDILDRCSGLEGDEAVDECLDETLPSSYGEECFECLSTSFYGMGEYTSNCYAACSDNTQSCGDCLSAIYNTMFFDCGESITD